VVIVTCGCLEKLEIAEGLGADHGIDRNAEDWAQAVWRINGDRSADQILEIAGGPNLSESLHAIAVVGMLP